MTLTAREIRFRSEYVNMMKTPQVLVESGITDMTQYHLYHVARYLSRLKGLIMCASHGLRRYLDNDLGACLLATVFVVDTHMMTTGDDGLTDLWRHFSASIDRFRNADTEVTMDDLESSFYAICRHCQFDPWKNTKCEQGCAPNSHAFGTFVTHPAIAGSAPKSSGSR